MITALRRYERWYKYQKKAPWLDGNPEGFEISKGHMFDHTAAFAVLWGANDNARLDNSRKLTRKMQNTRQRGPGSMSPRG